MLAAASGPGKVPMAGKGGDLIPRSGARRTRPARPKFLRVRYPGYPFPEETRREEMFAVVAAEQEGEAASAAGASVE